MTLEIYSDYICPWCYIAKARLQKIAGYLDIPLDLILLPHLLYPTMPPEGADKSVFAKKSKPGMGRSLRDEAKEEGLTLNYKNISIIPNSWQAHRMAMLIADKDLRYEFSQRVFDAYFKDATNISSIEAITNLATQAKIEEETLIAFQHKESGTKELQAALDTTHVSMVPTIRLDGKHVIPGLQSTETWTRYIQRAYKLKK